MSKNVSDLRSLMFITIVNIWDKVEQDSENIINRPGVAGAVL